MTEPWNRPIVNADLSVTVEADGGGTEVVLTAHTDVGLAEKLAKHMTGANAWDQLSFAEQTAVVGRTLRELRYTAYQSQV